MKKVKKGVRIIVVTLVPFIILVSITGQNINLKTWMDWNICTDILDIVSFLLLKMNYMNMHCLQVVS